MKSILSLFVLCAVAVSLSSAITKQEAMEKATEVGKKCQAQEGASDADFGEFIAHQIPTTEPSKCLRACVMETFNVLVDNKPNTDNALELAKKFSNNNPQAIQLMKELHEECNTVGVNRCETAFEIIKCSVASLKRRGVDLFQYQEA